MSARRLLGVYGQVQREGDVIHVIAKRLTDLSPMLSKLRDRSAPFPDRLSRGDGAQNGGGPADPRAGKPAPPAPRDIYIPPLHLDEINVKSWNFGERPPFRIAIRRRSAQCKVEYNRCPRHSRLSAYAIPEQSARGERNRVGKKFFARGSPFLLSELFASPDATSGPVGHRGRRLSPALLVPRSLKWRIWL
jgi:hypothetical protein